MKTFLAYIKYIRDKINTKLGYIIILKSKTDINKTTYY